MRGLRTTLWALAFLLSAGLAFGDQDAQRVEVYAVGWERMFRGRLDAKRARELAWIRTSIRGEPYVSRFITSLDLESMQPANPPESGDIRLVIDVTGGHGGPQTYLATYSALFTEDGTRSRAMSQQFRDRFTAVIGGTIP